MAAVLAIFCIFGLPIIAYIVVKTLAHNERMEMIRMGYYGGLPSVPAQAPADPFTPGVPRASASDQPSRSNVVLLPPLGNAAPDATLYPVRTVSGTKPRGT